MTSRRFQVIITGAKIGFALKPLRSVSRKRSKENITRMFGLCIDFDIGGQARFTSIRAWDAISAGSAFISALSGKYQVLWRTDCTTLERTGRHAETALITIVSAPYCTDCNRIFHLPRFPNCRYDPAYPVAVKYPSDSIGTPGDFRLDIAAANAMLLPCSAFRKAHEFRPRFGMLCPRTLIEETPKNCANAVFASCQCKQVLFT